MDHSWPLGKGNVCAHVHAYALALAAVDESLFTVHSWKSKMALGNFPNLLGKWGPGLLTGFAADMRTGQTYGMHCSGLQIVEELWWMAQCCLCSVTGACLACSPMELTPQRLVSFQRHGDKISIVIRIFFSKKENTSVQPLALWRLTWALLQLLNPGDPFCEQGVTSHLPKSSQYS